MKLHTTKDYSMFNYINGNRALVEAHVKSIMKSMVENGQLPVIVWINEKNEVIDGQHRLEACKRLGLPVIYIIKKGWTLKHVHLMNQDQKNWTINQFMESYSDMGRKDYQIYKFFKTKYGFGHNESIRMLTGTYCDGRGFVKFKNGQFKVKDLGEAQKQAEMICDFEPYFEDYKRRAFVHAMLDIFNRIPNYNHNQMMDKICYQSAKLTKQSTAGDYRLILEKIYNFKTRSEYVRFDLLKKSA